MKDKKPKWFKEFEERLWKENSITYKLNENMSYFLFLVTLIIAIFAARSEFGIQLSFIFVDVILLLILVVLTSKLVIISEKYRYEHKIVELKGHKLKFIKKNWFLLAQIVFYLLFIFWLNWVIVSTNPFIKKLTYIIIILTIIFVVIISLLKYIRKKKMKITKKKKIWFLVKLIVLFIIIFLLFLFGSIEFERKLYPIEEERFTLSSRFYGSENNCFSAEEMSLIRINLISNSIRLTHFLNSNCGDSDVITAYLHINTDGNLSKVKVDNNWVNHTNYTNNMGSVGITFFSAPEYGGHFTVDLFYKDSLFYNSYKIYPPSKNISRLEFIFNTAFLGGYYCSSDCFIIRDGLTNEEPIYYRSKDHPYENYAIKTYEDITGDRFIFKFNPQSRKVRMYIRLLETFALGLTVVILYEIIVIIGGIKYISKK